MTDPFWTPGLSPALARLQADEAATAEEAAAHIALDEARRVAAEVTGTDDDLFRGSSYTTAYDGSTFITRHAGEARAARPPAAGGISTSTVRQEPAATAVLSGTGEHLPGCSCGPCAGRAVTEILDVLSEPLGLPGDQLPSYDTAPAGTCQDCWRGPVYKTGRCLYCWTLTGLRTAAGNAARAPVPDWRDSIDGGVPGGGVLAAGRWCRCGRPGCGGLHCVRCGARPGQSHMTTCDRDAGYRDDSEPCSHGGRRQRFVRDGACRRCGTTRLTGRVPAARPRMHLHLPGQPRCAARARDRGYPGLRLAMMLSGWLLLTLAASQPGAVWLLVPAIVMMVLGYRGPRRRGGRS